MANIDGEKTTCRTPTPGKMPTKIDAHKFEQVRSAILNVLRRNPAGIEFKMLPEAVVDELGTDTMSEIGSSMWYTTTVKLELEVRGEVQRVTGRSPQVLRLGKKIKHS